MHIEMESCKRKEKKPVERKASCPQIRQFSRGISLAKKGSGSSRPRSGEESILANIHFDISVSGICIAD